SPRRMGRSAVPGLASFSTRARDTLLTMYCAIPALRPPSTSAVIEPLPNSATALKTAQAARFASAMLEKLKAIRNQPFLVRRPTPTVSARAAVTAPTGPRTTDSPRCRKTPGDHDDCTGRLRTAKRAIRNVVSPPAARVTASVGARTRRTLATTAPALA